jgi:hypothetical protein
VPKLQPQDKSLISIIKQLEPPWQGAAWRHAEFGQKLTYCVDLRDSGADFCHILSG